jgi:hypothetical protein
LLKVVRLGRTVCNQFLHGAFYRGFGIGAGRELFEVLFLVVDYFADALLHRLRDTLRPVTGSLVGNFFDQGIVGGQRGVAVIREGVEAFNGFGQLVQAGI